MVTKAQIHARISYIKSVIRLAGYVLLPVDLWAAAATLFISEVVGIAEAIFGG